MRSISLHYHPGTIRALLPRAFQIQEQLETLIFQHPSLTTEQHLPESSKMAPTSPSFSVHLLTIFTTFLTFTDALAGSDCSRLTHNDPQVTWQTTKCAFCGPNTSKANDTLYMNYNGTLLNGTLFDSSYTPEKPWPAGDPFNFTLGAGQVIKG